MGIPLSRPRSRRSGAEESFSRIDSPHTADVPSAPPPVAPVIGMPVANAVVMPMPMPAADSKLQLAVCAEKHSIAFGEEQTLLAMLSLRAPAAPAEVKRPPMDLVACIDRSGSMRGDKIELMKKTLELLVRRTGLNGDDRVSLVTFDSTVRLDMPLEPMSANGRSKAEAVISGLRPGSTTNLSGGALKAIDVLEQSAERAGMLTTLFHKADGAHAAGRTRAVMLFTDGLANEGIRETPKLVTAVGNALAGASARLGGPISLFTFGFGRDHSEDCLRALANGSGAGGLYYYVACAEDIPNAFADCLGGLTSVVAQNASVTLQGLGGASVGRVLGSTYTRDAEGALALGDLYADDAKDLLVEIKLTKLAAAVGAADEGARVLRAQLRAFNVATCAPEVVTATLEIARPPATPADQPVNEALDAQRNRLETAEAMECATRLADSGDVAAGREMLRAVRQRMAESISAAVPMSRQLMAECESLESTYENAARYQAEGSKMSKMSAMSHARQRANHLNVDTYGGGGKRKAALKASWMSSIASVSGHGSDSD